DVRLLQGFHRIGGDFGGGAGSFPEGARVRAGAYGGDGVGPDPLERLAPRRRLKGAALPRGWPFAKPPGAVHPAISAVHPVNPAVRPTLLQTRRCVVPLWRDSVFANWRSRMPHDA